MAANNQLNLRQNFMDFSLRNYGFHKRNFYKKLTGQLKTNYGENLEKTNTLDRFIRPAI